MTKYFKRHCILFLVLACLTIAAKAQVTPYGRIEIDNLYELTYGPWNDQYKEGEGDVIIRFYEDGACTIPYTLTSPLTVLVKYSFEQTWDGTPTGWGSEIQEYTAPAGYNYYSMGGRYLYVHHYDHPYQINSDDYYTVEDPGDGSYYPLPTVTN